MSQDWIVQKASRPDGSNERFEIPIRGHIHAIPLKAGEKLARGILALLGVDVAQLELENERLALIEKGVRAFIKNPKLIGRLQERLLIPDVVSGNIDVTHLVEFQLNDNENLPLTRCVCGKRFPPWDFILGVYADTPHGCLECGRRLYFDLGIRVYEVGDDQ